MAKKIFVNLPVRNLNASIEFFTQVGFAFNQQFSDENATCMVISEDIYVMLLVEPFFQTFTPKAIADSSQSTEVIICLSADSRAEVDALVDKAMAAGAKQSKPLQNHDFMYARNFQDPDGHLWEVMHMDPAVIEQAQAAAVNAV
ncbi:glyoxalase/bleomycin resistance/extradiol dioxygenase family protein [Hymenobacter oligotrophus]|uniref:Glyoxalase/bleomycin resistance/extradiol dioxygenase family protein n=1 Tax=Hymenobacter oligotrophus TaxID=2319843 RepID=A0A3B7R1J6_9BACT|nr:VOC family protein [Hymenobacter oligotrophus]AYA37642.1 glyoxalase/bleomycin resistance/extradiol dioxygenase family protein [Hymenobacter oligotrophus]